MEDGKGEELLSEVPANGWLWLRDYVRRWRGRLSDIRATTSRGEITAPSVALLWMGKHRGHVRHPLEPKVRTLRSRPPHG